MPQPKIRVGFVLHGLQVAGAEMLVVQLIQRLADCIHPTVFCLDATGATGEQTVPNLGLETTCDVVPLGRRPGRDFRVAWRLARHVRCRNIEVLHAHQYSPFFYAALAKALAARRVRLIFTEHGRHYPDRVSTRRWAVNRLFLDRMADAVDAVSRFSADSLADQDGFSRRRIEVIENGVDLGRFSQDAQPPVDLDSTRRYLVNVARFHPVKDQATLLRAFQEVAADYPDVDLLLVGDGGLRGELERLSQELGLGQRIRFLGVRRDVPAILQASEIFVLTSLSEAAPLTLLEAMAAGLPVVATAVGGVSEIVHDGVEGLLVPRQNAKGIASALRRLLDDPALAAAMGAAAAKRVRDSFTIERTVERYFALYSRLASRA